MLKKKENLLDKIVKKDYDNQLELILETKNFDEKVKNLLLEILYKVETSYKDYKDVKREVQTKKEYIEKIIQTIEENCEEIQLVMPTTIEEAKENTIQIDKKRKKIICLSTEGDLLYSIAEIVKKDEILQEKEQIINEVITRLINEGNNIEVVEPLRDFNGWSWTIIKKEIKNVEYNLIYQNLRILLGNNFLEDWIENKDDINYYEKLKNKLEEKYSSKIKDCLIEKLEKVALLIAKKTDSQIKREIDRLSKETKEILEKFQNKIQYIDEITIEKKEIQEKIKKINKILSEKEELKLELDRRNKKISSKINEKQLIKILNEEKSELRSKFTEKNKLLNPKIFLEEKQRREYLSKLLQRSNLNNELLQFEIVFLEAFLLKVNGAQTKEEIINLIYDFRYYQMLPYNEEINIYENKKLQPKIKEIEEKLLKKALKNKVVNEHLEPAIFHYIFITQIINLEGIGVRISKEEDKIVIEFSENNNNEYDEKFEINKEEIDENNIFRSNRNGNRFKFFS